MTVASKRQSLGELMAQAGSGDREIALELLLMLPDDFVREYELLYHKVWGTVKESPRVKQELSSQSVTPQERAERLSGSEVGGRSDDRVGDGVSSSEVDAETGGAGRKGNRIKDRDSSRVSGFGIRDEHALKVKQRVDRKLRGIARELRDQMMPKNDRPVKACKLCGKFVQRDWHYCPWCGYQSQADNEWPGKGSGQ